MRNIFCDILLEYSANEYFVFLTGDVGFMVLEPLQKKMGPRFINMGIAEQNMVSVAAGLAMAALLPLTTVNCTDPRAGAAGLRSKP